MQAFLGQILETQAGLETHQYADFLYDMDFWGYSFDAHEVATDDGFILTTFHITGNRNQEVSTDPSRAPVLLMHGQGCDAENWVNVDPDDLPDKSETPLPLPLHLFDDGFDVWMASNRGTKYCQQHKTLEFNTKEYWEYSWAEMGKYDDVANINFVKAQTGASKVSYVGVSQGTVQMFYGLATDKAGFFAENLFTFAAIDPCTIQVNDNIETDVYTDGLFKFRDYGIYVLGGPDWNKDRKTICDNFNQDVCDYAESYAEGEPVTVRTNEHWAQNVLQYRFQEYAPDYTRGQTQTDLIDLASIQGVPISVWSGELDVTCSNFEARKTVRTIGEDVFKFRTVREANHSFWGGKLRTDELFKEFREALINPQAAGLPTY